MTEPDPDAWPIDALYEDGIDLSPNPADLLYQEQEAGWEEITFEPVDVSEEKLAALADAATQMHYIYLSQVMMMGDLLWNAPDIGTKRLATVLSASRMRDVDAWGRYIAHLELVRPEISPPLRDYFQELYAEENRFARLMGLMFVDVLRKALADELQDVEDPTFRRLMQRDAREGAKNVKMTREHLQHINSTIDDDTRETAEGRMDDLQDRIEAIIADRGVTLETLDVDPENILDECRSTLSAYRSIISSD